MAPIHKLWHSYSQAKDFEHEINKPEERVLLILRAHPITNTGWLLMGLGLFMLPLVFGNYLTSLGLSPNQELFMIVFWYAFVLSYLLGRFYLWYFNIGVVTNRKIIDVDANNLLNTITTATIVPNVEEVEKKSLGIMSSFFNYGDVHIETAGEFPSIEFLKIPHPSEVVKIINSNMKINGRSNPPS